MSDVEEMEEGDETIVSELQDTVSSGEPHQEYSEDEPIWPVTSVKRRRKSYIPPAGILRIFPDITPEILCELSELK